MLSPAWTPDAPMKRIILHWTAGTYKANDTDRKAYHILIEGDGSLIKGLASIALNGSPLSAGYAAHTLNCNSNSIGVSLCCMGNAVESPFNAGAWPMTRVQFDKMIEVVKDLCAKYKIPVTPQTVLSHAEVQATLGITQRNKWDYTRLAFDEKYKGAKVIGDYIRSLVSSSTESKPHPVIPAGAILRAIGTGVTHIPTYDKPNGQQLGSVPLGLTMSYVRANDDNSWLYIKTPAGYNGWVPVDSVELVDSPPVTKPTTPSPLRDKINEIRKLLDELEADI